MRLSRNSWCLPLVLGALALGCKSSDDSPTPTSDRTAGAGGAAEPGSGDEAGASAESPGGAASTGGKTGTGEGGDVNLPGVGGDPTVPGSWDESFWDKAVWQ